MLRALKENGFIFTSLVIDVISLPVYEYTALLGSGSQLLHSSQIHVFQKETKWHLALVLMRLALVLALGFVRTKLLENFWPSTDSLTICNRKQGVRAMVMDEKYVTSSSNTYEVYHHKNGYKQWVRAMIDTL